MSGTIKVDGTLTIGQKGSVETFYLIWLCSYPSTTVGADIKVTAKEDRRGGGRIFVNGDETENALTIGRAFLAWRDAYLSQEKLNAR